jgi:hypothetical protein
MTSLIGLTICGWIGGVLTVAAARAEPCSNQSLRNGPSESLPDCRAYEQVSPVAKGGYDAISRVSFLQYAAQAAPTGEGVVYMGDGPFPGALGSFFPDAHLSTRNSAGWQTSDVTPPSSAATPSVGLATGVVGYDFSEDLSQLVVKVISQPLAPLSAGNEGLFNLFLQRNGSYSLVNTPAPSEFAPEGEECYRSAECFAYYDIAAFAGASSNFDRILFETNDSLLGTGAPGGFVENLYETSDGQVHLVGILPDGAIASGGAQPGAGGSAAVETTAISPKRWSDVNHAISADGTRILFRAIADGGAPDPSQSGMAELYDRIDGSRTVEISAPAAGATPANTNPEPAQFWSASRDGSLAFFTSSAELTTNSKTGSENNSSDIYRYDVTSGALTDLTVDTNPIDASTGAGVQGVAGVSEDGSYVYFVATGQLVSGKGVDGQSNLYLWHEDASTHASELKFIATLAEGDSEDWTSTPANLRAYVTPDGRHLAFMSLNSLTGYSHQANSEVYEYSAETGGLVCASCNPNGAAPVGSAFTGATPQELASTAFHQPRVLSDDGGRLFFSSPDPLLPGNATPSTKLYEYEQLGVGSCQTAHGCLYRISSGSGGGSGAVDVFLDADATGSNVFFASLSQLAPTDGDGLYDIYDARVGGGVPSASIPSRCPPGCSDGGISSPPSSPTPGSQQVLGSATHPAAEIKKSKPLSCQAKARRTKNAKKRASALKRCPKPRHRRTSHGRAR